MLIQPVPSTFSFSPPQLWLNVPSARKMDAPRYGTVEPSKLPLLAFPGGVTARLLAGTINGVVSSPDSGSSDVTGPFTTVQPVLMLDVTLPAPATPTGVTTFTHSIPSELDSVMAFVYWGAPAGGVTVNGRAVGGNSVVLLDAKQAGARGVTISVVGAAPASVLIFAGKRLNQPVAWRGPFVMTTQAELAQTMVRGVFCVAAWD